MKNCGMKQSKKTIRNRLDKEFSTLIRARGKCEFTDCGNTQILQTAHIFSRRFLRLRWNPNNVFCFCAKHHWWGSDNPILFADFVKEKLGPKKYQILLDERNNLEKYEWPEKIDRDYLNKFEEV